MTQSERNMYECLKELCERRRSVRKFQDRAVSSVDIERIKKVAYTSPYASGKKNWEINVVRERDKIIRIAGLIRSRTEELAGSVREDFRENFTRYARSFTAFESAPVLFIPSFRISSTLSPMLGDDRDVELWERDNFVKSISCVAMLILLAAESLGLGGCYMTGPLIAEDLIAREIGIKAGRNIGAIIPVGYAEE